MKTVVYSCCFVPCELIAAHGLRPKRLLPWRISDQSVGPTEGLCVYAREFVDCLCCDDQTDAAVMTTVCDQMRRAAELIGLVRDIPVFLMNVPATWQSSDSWQLYLDELERLSAFLVGLGGERPSDDHLAQVMLTYEALRERLVEARASLSAGRLSMTIAEISQGALDGSFGQQVARADGIAVAVIGGELGQGDLEILDLIEPAGGRVVLNATDLGERALPGKFDRRQLKDEPLLELANAYFGTIPHAFRRPNSSLYSYLKKEIAERGVRGLIFRRHQWCDIWNAELHRLREWSRLPVLDLDMASQQDDLGWAAGRLQAFMETLR